MVHHFALHGSQSTNVCLQESWPNGWHYEDIHPEYGDYPHVSHGILLQQDLLGRSVLPPNTDHTNPSTILPRCHAYRKGRTHSVLSVLLSAIPLYNHGLSFGYDAYWKTIHPLYKIRYRYPPDKHTPILLQSASDTFFLPFLKAIYKSPPHPDKIHLPLHHRLR